MSITSRTTTGITVLALLGLLDIGWVIVAWTGAVDASDAPPAGALALFAVIGALTLAMVQPARRGSRSAAWIMIGSRLVSVCFVDLTAILLDAPAWVVAVTSVAIVLTALGIWCTAPLVTRRGATQRAAG